MAEEVRITGLDGVRKALRALPREVAKREVRKALRPGAKIIHSLAVAKAPSSGAAFTRNLRGKEWTKERDNLRNSIAIRGEKKKYLFDTARLRVGVLSSARSPNVGAWYWRFVEFGTSKMAARPFLRPAFMQGRFAADKAIRAALFKGVQRQARRVRGK